jgi:hypothetical protein
MTTTFRVTLPEALLPNTKDLIRLLRCEAHLDRKFTQTLRHLERPQKARHAQEAENYKTNSTVSAPTPLVPSAPPSPLVAAVPSVPSNPNPAPPITPHTKTDKTNSIPTSVPADGQASTAPRRSGPKRLRKN